MQIAASIKNNLNRIIKRKFKTLEKAKSFNDVNNFFIKIKKNSIEDLTSREGLILFQIISKI